MNVLQNDLALFGQLYISMQHQEGDFFFPTIAAISRVSTVNTGLYNYGRFCANFSDLCENALEQIFFVIVKVSLQYSVTIMTYFAMYCVGTSLEL
jgi:hypothetical protein